MAPIVTNQLLVFKVNIYLITPRLVMCAKGFSLMRSTLIDINIFYIFSIIFIDINSWGQWCVLRCQWFSLRSSIVCLALHQLDGTLRRHHLHNQHCHHRHHCHRHQRNLWYWFTIYGIYQYINTIIDAIIMVFLFIITMTSVSVPRKSSSISLHDGHSANIQGSQ